MKVSLFWVSISRLKADHWAYHELSTIDSRANIGYQSTSSQGRNKRIWLVQFCAWSSAKVTNVSASWHLENKFWQVCFWPLPFVHAVVLPPGLRLWSVEHLLRFCPFPNEMSLDPLPPIFKPIRLETKYKLMIWSLCIVNVQRQLHTPLTFKIFVHRTLLKLGWEPVTALRCTGTMYHGAWIMCEWNVTRFAMKPSFFFFVAADLAEMFPPVTFVLA